MLCPCCELAPSLPPSPPPLSLSPISPQLKELGKVEVPQATEEAWFVTLKPLEWEGEFCLALRIVVSVPQRGKPHKGFVAAHPLTHTLTHSLTHSPLSLLEGLNSLSVMYWNYLYQSAGCTITPQPIIGETLSECDRKRRGGGSVVCECCVCEREPMLPALM